MTFADRTEAGQKLARKLGKYAQRDDIAVLGIPRGGLPVAFEIATELGAPLDVFIARKLGVPGQEELAFGAVASGGVRYLDREIVESLGIAESDIARVTEQERKELERRENVYRGGRPAQKVEGRTAILVDDGIATGASMEAAIAALRQLRPARIVVAVPVAPQSTCKRLRPKVDDLVCLQAPELFYAIGQFYDDFSQLTDAEVIEMLHRSASVGAKQRSVG